MNPRPPLDPQSLEALSAYLDGKLTGADLAALEEQLKRDEALRTQLSELRTVRESLRSLPSLKPPRALTLSPAQAGVAARRPGGVSSRWMALGSALAALAFVVVASVDIFSQGFFMAAAPRPAEPAALQARESVMTAESPPLDKSGAGFSAEVTATGEPEPAAAIEPTEPAVADGCGGCTAEDTEPGPLGLTNAFSRPETSNAFSSIPAASYLEVFLGLSAVLLAVLAMLFRRKQ